MSRLASAVLVLCGACSFSADYGGTGYMCAEDMTCPAGQMCVEGRCQVGPPPMPDAAVPPPTPDAMTEMPDAMSVPLDPPWWDDAWSTRRQITVTNTSAQAVLDGMPVGFAQDVEDWIGATAPYASIRLMHWNPSTQVWAQMPRIIDTSAVDGHELIWIEMWEPLVTDQSVSHYWIYYGNPDPSGAEPVDNNPEYVFEYYNAFTATDLSIEFIGSATVIGGDLQLGPGASVRTLTQWGTGYAVDFELRVPTWGSRIWGGFQRNADFLDDEPWALWITRTPHTGQIWPEFLAYESGMVAADLYEGPLHDVGATQRRYTVERFSDRVVYRLEDAVVDEFLLPGPFVQQTQVRLTNESLNDVYFDMLRVRPTVYPAPSVVVGPEVFRP